MLDFFEDGIDHPRNDTLLSLVVDIRSLHRVGFAARGLSVCKNSPIKSIQHTIYSRLPCDLKKLLLSAIHPEHSVEHKIMPERILSAFLQGKMAATAVFLR